MPDLLSVCMQDFLYSRKSELRAQIIRRSVNDVSSGILSAAYSYETGKFRRLIPYRKGLGRNESDSPLSE